MKRIFFICICLYTTIRLFAIDMVFDANAGKFGIKQELNRTKSGTPASFFDSHTFNFLMQDEIASNILVTAQFSRDNIMQNSILASGSLQLKNVSFSVGPYFTVGAAAKDDLTSGKIFDSDNLFLPGILLGTEIGNPGHITGFFTMKTSLSQDAGDMAFKMYSLGLRFWVPNVICEARFDQKKSQKTLEGVAVTTSQTDAGAYFDIYQKALPFRFTVKGLWRNISRSYDAGYTADSSYSFNGTTNPDGTITGTMTPNTETMQGAPGTDSVNYIVVGGSITFIPDTSFQWYAGAECSVFSWYPSDDNQHLTGLPDASLPPLSVTVGLKYRFNNKEPARGYKAAEKSFAANDPDVTDESAESDTISE